MRALKLNIVYVCAATLLGTSACSSSSLGQDEEKLQPTVNVNENAEEGIISYLSGAAYITQDIDASVDFYTEYFGFVERRRSVLDNDGTRAVFGLETDESVIYSALAPINFSKDRPDFTGLNFAQINRKIPTPFSKDAQRAPMFGEPVMAFNVTQLKETEQKMRDAGVTIVDPLKISPTGRSMTLTVLDPNGIRVQMYEMIQ